VAIGGELADMGATVQEVAPTFAVMAAAMLAEAFGGRWRLVDWQPDGPSRSAREARAVIARNASTV
jgi:hypothetical protein